MVGRGSGSSANGSRRDGAHQNLWLPVPRLCRAVSGRSAASLRFDVAARWERLGARTGPMPRIFDAKTTLAAKLSELFGSLAPPTCGHLDLLNAYAKQHVIRD